MEDYYLKWMFLPINSGDNWGVILWNTDSIPGVEVANMIVE
jgi:hypothetical protein